MRTLLVASAALAALSCAFASIAQTGSAFSVDTLTALPGSWSYRSYPGGSEAAFADASGTRLTIRCNRVARTVSIVRGGVSAASPTLAVWTSSLSRSLPARFDTSVLAADVAATDPLLDAISLSRGKFATSALGAPLLAYPNWPEPTRVIEDCRT